METKKYKVNIIKHNRFEGHVYYVLSVENPSTGLNITFKERYSNLRNVYEIMKKEAANKNFPPFPPKKFFGYEDEKFVSNRQEELNKFFEKINSNESFSNLSSYIKFLEENIKKNPNKEKISSRQIQYSTESRNLSQNIFKIFDEKRLTPEEFIKESLEGKKIVDKYKGQFVSLDYEIEQKTNEKIENKYKNIIKDDLLNNNNNDEINNNKIVNGNDDNFNTIGKEDEYIDKATDKIKNIIEINVNKFQNLSKLMDSDEFLLTLKL